ARRVGQGQVALGHHRLGRDHLDLPVRREAVVVEGGLFQVVHRIGVVYGLVCHLAGTRLAWSRDCGTTILVTPATASAPGPPRRAGSGWRTGRTRASRPDRWRATASAATSAAAPAPARHLPGP